MKIQSMKFNAGQAVGVMTYLDIMTNAFEWLYIMEHGNRSEYSFFMDAVTLMRDKTMDKTDLANEIIKEFTDDYHDQKGAYMMADVKEAGFDKDVFDWLISVHNQAVKTVRAITSLGGVSVSVIK